MLSLFAWVPFLHPGLQPRGWKSGLKQRLLLAPGQGVSMCTSSEEHVEGEHGRGPREDAPEQYSHLPGWCRVALLSLCQNSLTWFWAVSRSLKQ